MNIRVFVLYWDKSPLPVPAINGFPRKQSEGFGARTDISPGGCCREWTFNGGCLVTSRKHLQHMKTTKQPADKVRFAPDSSSLWCFVCGDAQLWNEEVQRVGGCIAHRWHTITTKEMLWKERRRKMLHPFIRHNHWQTALFSEEPKNPDSSTQRAYEKHVCVHVLNTIVVVTQRATVSWTGTH